jgi:hypothetical protein
MPQSRYSDVTVWNHHSSDHYEVRPGQMFKVHHSFGNNGSVDTARETPRSARPSEREKSLNLSQQIARTEHLRGITFDSSGALLSSRHLREQANAKQYSISDSNNPLVKRAGRQHEFVEGVITTVRSSRQINDGIRSNRTARSIASARSEIDAMISNRSDISTFRMEQEREALEKQKYEIQNQLKMLETQLSQR